VGAAKVSLPNNIGYVHVPKTGGTFIKKWFKDNGITIYSRGHERYEDSPEQARWWFATVRNPYHRMVSWYEFFREKAERELKRNSRPPDRYHKMLEIHNKGFKHFLTHGDDAVWYLHRTQCRWVDGVDHVMRLEDIYTEWHQIYIRTGCDAALPSHTAKTKDFERFGYDKDKI
jgi:hypothetical protein